MKKIHVLLPVVVSVAIVFLWVLKPWGSDVPKAAPKRVIPVISQAEVDAAIASQRIETDKKKAYLKKISEDETFAESELRRIVAENPQAKRAVMLIKAATFPIEFHGKVVDTQNNPLANVNIHYSIGAAFGVGEAIHSSAITDNNGLYVIKGNGSTVALLAFFKRGYLFDDRAVRFYSSAELERPNVWMEHKSSHPYITVAKAK